MDAFALLNEPRRPWVDVDALKTRFLAISSAAHPDRFHGVPETERLAATARYSELNTAYGILREPRDRLLHLIELEAGGKPKDIQRIPPGTMDLFIEVGQGCREADEFLKAKSEATSPMLKLSRMREAMGWIDRFQQLQGRVNAQRDRLMETVRELNAAWDSAPPLGSPERSATLPLEALEQTYRSFSYVERWTGQLQERLIQFAM
ncbi:MAG: DnaJ family molecular chaperone [Verrucomicrobiota bacterium]